MEEIWKDVFGFEGSYEVSNLGRIRSIARQTHINNPNLSSPVVCLKDGNIIAEYPSMWEAQRQTGAMQQNIMKCCQGKRHTAGGYGWRYKDGRKKPIVMNRDYSKTKPYYKQRANETEAIEH